MKNTLCFALAAAALFAGCTETRRGSGLPMTLPGGDSGMSETSGLPPTLPLSSLDASQIMRLCEWGIDIQGGPSQSWECSDSLTVSTGTVAECVDGLESGASDCDITVGEMEDCLRALGRDACNVLDDPACAPVRACGMASSDGF